MKKRLSNLNYVLGLGFICIEKLLSAYSIGLRRNGLGSIDVSFEIRIYVTHVPWRITCQLVYAVT